jgi:trans-aconitate 2-methyltransferase
MARTWDAGSYDRIGGPMTAMAMPVVERAALRGDEVVLDAGCGTGRVSELLLDRVPDGKVLAVDADPAMVTEARQVLGDRAPVEVGDLTTYQPPEPVDVVFSTATFHWILDHRALFENLFSVLRPGGRLVAQCGGDTNISVLKGVARQVLASRPEWAATTEGWTEPWRYATPEQTEQLLGEAGFVDVRCWLQPHPITPDDPVEYFTTVPLGPYVDRLGPEQAPAFIDAVVATLRARSGNPSEPVTADYVRLNIEAVKPGS